VLAHDLGEGTRLITGRDLLAGPLLRVLRNRGVVGRAEGDPFGLDRVAGRVVAVDAHEDRHDPEDDQQATGDESADLPNPSALHRSTSR
jgi:hypothetical protein